MAHSVILKVAQRIALTLGPTQLFSNKKSIVKLGGALGPDEAIVRIQVHKEVYSFPYLWEHEVL